MACPPGHIQIRRDTVTTWNHVNPNLLSGELAYGTDVSGPIIKIGPGLWKSALQIYPQNGGGGGGVGATGPQGTSAYQLVAIDGNPTITLPENPSTLPGSTTYTGYTITCSAGNDVVSSINPSTFSTIQSGIVFTCILPISSNISLFDIGFNNAYVRLTPNQNTFDIYYYNVVESSKLSNSYSPGDTLTIMYNGNGTVSFTIIGTTTTSTMCSHTNSLDYVYLGFYQYFFGETIAVNDVNIYSSGVVGATGPQGPGYTTIQSNDM